MAASGSRERRSRRPVWSGAAARALRQARAGQDPDRGGLLTNLGRPAP